MEIVPSVSIDNLINQRTAIVHKLEQVFALLRECDTLAGAAHLDFPEISLESGRWMSHRTRLVGSYADSPEQANRDVLRVLDCSAWQYLMHESGDVPELSAQNIEATFDALFEARGEMFERGVLACFQGLSWDYKTNQPFKFGKRIIVDYLMTHGSPNDSATNRLDDLVRVLHVLDRKPEPDHRSGMSALLWRAYHARETAIETEYLNLKWFKKGSGHVTFKRPELVEKMNAILAKHYPNAIAREK